jgi:hypothetical protein
VRGAGQCEDGAVTAFEVRPGGVDDARALAELFAAIAEEGRRVKHYRRASGELWDSIVMGLLL